MFMNLFLGVVLAFTVLIILFLVNGDCVIVMFISSSLGVVDAYLVSMVLFLIGCDCDVHELFS